MPESLGFKAGTCIFSMLDFKKMVKKDPQPYRFILPLWLGPCNFPSVGDNSPEGLGKGWVFFRQLNANLWGFGQLCSIAPSPGLREVTLGTLRAIAGAKHFQVFAVLFLPPWMIVTCSDLCPVVAFKPISVPASPWPQFTHPAH